MQSNKDIPHIERVKEVAYRLNIPEEVIELSLFYASEYIKKKIAESEIDKDILLSKEEFESKLPIISIPNLGYLKPNYYKYKQIHRKAKLAREKNKEENNERESN